MANTIIIGGGVIGLSVAYHLAKRGQTHITLLERNQLTSGTSWHAAGIVGPLRATPNMTQIARYALELFPQLEQESKLSTGFKTTGGYWLAQQPERLDELHRIAALGRTQQLTASVIGADDMQTELPFLQLSSHCGALKVAEDANVNPVDLCMAYAQVARRLGVDIHEGIEVTKIRTTNNKVTGVYLADDSQLDAEQVVICCGAWSKPLAATAGLALPLQAVEHMYIVTEPLTGIPEPFPVIRDLDNGIYIKGDTGGKVVMGGFEANAKCWNAFSEEGDRAFLELPEDWEQFSGFMDAALRLMPQLENAGVQRFMNGPESFTADTRPLIGEAPATRGLYVAAGMNSVGVMSSAGVGRVLADWIADDAPPMDLWEVDISRCDPRCAEDDHMQSRMQESVHDLFAMHWPFKQPQAGRNLRQSCLHNRWQQQGAVFGLTAGWERGLWYANHANERQFPYSVLERPWQQQAQREAAFMQTGTVLVDLTPFSKFDVIGDESLNLLQQLACSSIDIRTGKCVYTVFLNKRGGIEADVTITRLSDQHFRVTASAATRWRDLSLLTRAAESLSVTVTDVTETEAVIGVMGQGSRQLLQSLTTNHPFSEAYGSSESISLDNIPVRAQRTSFSGELGWELYIANTEAAAIFDALIDRGAKPMGHYALESCRIEKGFRHWGHDIGPDTLLPETGLPVRVDWQKDFNGKQALEKLQVTGVNQRLCLLQVDGRPLVLHDEPVHEGNQVVGLTTSGTQGVRTDQTLAFAYIDIATDETPAQTAERQLQIEIGGNNYPATCLLRPPFDPAGKRMRA